MWLELFGLIVVLISFLYYKGTRNNDFFAKRGIQYKKPIPYFGNLIEIVFRRKSFFDIILEFYNKTNDPVYGIFDQTSPIFFVREPEIIKSITIKDFDHFVNHRSGFGADEDNLFVSSLFIMKDGKWKDMRSTLSPAFTGSKMRLMYQLINKVAEDTVNYLKLEKSIHTAQGLELDVKDYTTRFTNDIIASAAFGIEVNSFESRNNEFFRMGKAVTNFTFWQNIKFFLYALMPALFKLFKIDLFDKTQTDYFKRLVLDAMKYRKENNISRPDMINLLMEARGMIKSDNPKTHNRVWTDNEIVGQCFLFFFAGFETASVLMCFAAHELMENPDCQKKLLEEIEEVTAQLDGKPLTYEALQGMKYMDMVVSETLRKWPPVIAIDRTCSKDYIYKTDDGKTIEIKKDENVWLGVVGLHRDPKYYENPDQFDPERFSEENKAKINQFAYLPFGLGPRNCIGSRFALLEAKALLFYFVREFNIEASEKTCRPMVIAATSFQLMPKTGFWLKLTSRNKA